VRKLALAEPISLDDDEALRSLGQWRMLQLEPHAHAVSIRPYTPTIRDRRDQPESAPMIRPDTLGLDPGQALPVVIDLDAQKATIHVDPHLYGLVSMLDRVGHQLADQEFRLADNL
jgi:hypothetical protein